MATLITYGHFPLEHFEFLQELAKLLPRSRLLAYQDRYYPAADVLLAYQWEGLRVSHQMPCEDFLTFLPYSNAHRTKTTLQHLALMALWSAGRQD